MNRKVEDSKGRMIERDRSVDLSKNNQYLRSMELKKDKIESFSKYPFCLPAIKSLITLEFHPKVTFIVGENGSGNQQF